MSSTEIIDNIIKGGKWVKNDIGMGRVQCSKLVRDKEKMMIILISDKIEFPICSQVEKMVVVNGEIIMFYDGQYYERVEEEEYDRYKDYLSRDEWSIIHGSEPIKKLEEKNMISDTDGFYAEIHETVNKYIEREYDKKATDELNLAYKL